MELLLANFLRACFALFLFCGTLNALSQTSVGVYSDIIPTSSGLPFDPATDFRQTFVAANGKDVEVLVKGPQGSGDYSRAIRAGETPDAYFPAVVDEAVQAGAHRLIVPYGKYAFKGPEVCTDATNSACDLPTACNAAQYYNCAPFWTIGTYPQGSVTVPNSMVDMDIDLSGSELDFNAPIIGIWILEAQRVRMRNFTVDWPKLPIASLGSIVEDPNNPGHHALVLDSEYAVTDPYQARTLPDRAGPVQIQAVDIWDGTKETEGRLGIVDPPGTFDPKSNNYFETYFIFGNAPQPTYVGKTSAGAQTFSCISCHFQNSATDPRCDFFSGCANFDSFAVGTRVVVRHYTYNGFALLVYWSNDVTFENVTLLTGPGNGFNVGPNGGYRGFRLANSRVMRAPGRPVSLASVAVNIGMKADVILENNDIGYQGDDSVDISNTTAMVTAVAGATVTTPVACSPDPMDEPVVGDRLAFFDADAVYLGTARVVSAKGAFCGVNLTLTLDHVVAGVNTSSTLLDLTQEASARFVVRGNLMHECRCHGAQVNASLGSIDHNIMFANTAGGLGLTSGDGQGIGTTLLSFTHNIVANSGQGTAIDGSLSAIGQNADGSIATAAVFEDLDISDNILLNMPGPAILATSTRGLSFERNTIYDSNQSTAAPAYYGSTPTTDSILLYASSDGEVCSTRIEGKTTGKIGIDPDDKSVRVDASCAGQ